MGKITDKDEDKEEFQVIRNRKHLRRGRVQVWNPKPTQPEKGVKEMMTTRNQLEALHDPELRDAKEMGTKKKTPIKKWVENAFSKPKRDEEQRNTIVQEDEVTNETNQDQKEIPSSYMDEGSTLTVWKPNCGVENVSPQLINIIKWCSQDKNFTDI
ncbi:hypothetical protein KY290_020345 [Solanum tuberosum]|uniref:Uncharacterized protein n=1 Tax=Solanum tuberosum TaxID=4113 RepID=A0ABQ7UYE0_SOLTU|nr:hypothetical protein KY290_020345 [Solanum tuberosum]